MNGHKGHGPVPQYARVDDGLVGHFTKNKHNGRVKKYANSNPRDIERHRNKFSHSGMYHVLAFVQDSSENEKPSIQFNRKTRAHEPTVFRPSKWTAHVGDRYKMVLIFGERVPWFQKQGVEEKRLEESDSYQMIIDRIAFIPMRSAHHTSCLRTLIITSGLLTHVGTHATHTRSMRK